MGRTRSPVSSALAAWARCIAPTTRSSGATWRIKILPAQWTADSEHRSRFEREARLLAALNHPNIGAIYGIEDRAGVRGLVLELVEGHTVAERIARGLRLTDALSFAQQIATALEAAHERGIVHRDLKPANIKITPEGTAKVLDFGVARSGRGNQRLFRPDPFRPCDRRRHARWRGRWHRSVYEPGAGSRRSCGQTNRRLGIRLPPL